MKRLILNSCCLFGAMTAMAEPVWTKGTYADDEYVEVANRLNSNTGNALQDGNITTPSNNQAGNYSSYTYTFDSSKDLTDVRIYTSWKDTGRVGFSVSNLMVKCEGASDFVEIPGTAVEHYWGSGGVTATNRLFAALADSANGYLAERVIAVRIAFGKMQNNGTGIAEIEVAGVPSVAETLTANCGVASGELSASVGTLARDYPVTVHFCSGAVDGGDEPSAWGNDVEVGSCTDSSTVLVYNSAASFAFGRFYFSSPAYGGYVWSDIVEVTAAPSGSVAVSDVTTGSATLAFNLVSPGAQDSAADVALAYAPSDESLPPPTALCTGMLPGAVLTNCVGGLLNGTTYKYAYTLVNASNKTNVLEGTFTTLAAGVWTSISGYADSDFVWPRHHLSGGVTDASTDGVLPASPNQQGTYRTIGLNSSNKWTFSSPHDLREISIYMKDNGRNDISFTNGVLVKYSGAAEYTKIAGSELAYTHATAANHLLKYTSTDEFFATNVVEFMLVATQVENGYTTFQEVVVEGLPSDYDKVEWEYGSHVPAEYSANADSLEAVVASRANFDAREYDDDISSSYYKPDSGSKPYENGTGRFANHDYTWNFTRPVQMNGVEVFSCCTSNGGRNQFSVYGFYVKENGAADFVRVAGSSLDRFSFSTNNYARLVSAVSDRYPIKNIVAAKLVMGPSVYGHVGSFIAEVHPLGRPTPGFMVIIR